MLAPPPRSPAELRADFLAADADYRALRALAADYYRLLPPRPFLYLPGAPLAFLDEVPPLPEPLAAALHDAALRVATARHAYAMTGRPAD
jgi:hypothetical protein